ncbi:hypothetical protein BASA60_005768 [Batrachochytrium salamandrivorans]|nr:hypothetical protein BASA60_005768 [Batrachochytrium salamandrivorans]
MVNLSLIITSILFAILVIIGAIYFVVYFQSPTDKWVAWFPKVVVITSLSLAAWNIFLLPLDVANQSGREDNKDDEDGVKRSASGQFGYAIKWIIPTLAFAAGIVAAMYWGGLGYAEITTTYLQSPLFDTTDLEVNSLVGFYNFQFYCNTSAVGKTITLTPRFPLGVNSSVPVYAVIPAANTALPSYGCSALSGAPICCTVTAVNEVVVSIGVFIIAVITLVGWIIFAVFGGVGMAALPYDMLSEFQNRPKPINSIEYGERKIKIGQQAQLLIEVCKTLNVELKEAARGNSFNKRYRTIKNRERQFRKDVLIIDYHYRNLEESYRFQGGNILLHYIKFFLACLSTLLTLLWVIHIGLYVIPSLLQQKGQAVNPVTPFLNDMLNLTQGVPVVGIFLYSLFTFYLLFCVLKGNAKLGMRLVFITLHPLVVGETLMSSLVFNAGVILLCSLPLAQFCNVAFSDYAKYTSNQSIFGVSISTLKGISFGYDACVYVMLGFLVLTFFYNMYNPYKKEKANQLKFNW